MKFLTGLLLGLSVSFFLGAVAVSNHLQLSGELGIRTHNYQSTFSGILPDGKTYLAVTNSGTGQTEVFEITEHVRSQLKDVPGGRQGSVILNVSMK